MAKKNPFENSKFDNDKGVKEGSKADMKRDAKEQRQMYGKKGAKGRGKK